MTLTRKAFAPDQDRALRDLNCLEETKGMGDGSHNRSSRRPGGQPPGLSGFGRSPFSEARPHGSRLSRNLTQLPSPSLDLPQASARTLELRVGFDLWPYHLLFPDLAWFLHARSPEDLAGLDLRVPPIPWLPRKFPDIGSVEIVSPGPPRRVDRYVPLYMNLAGLQAREILDRFCLCLKIARQNTSGPLFLIVGDSTVEVLRFPEPASDTLELLS